MSHTQFDKVSVETLANITHEGRCHTRAILFEDGRKKMLGIILPCNDEGEEYQFETQTSERIEIISGECEVKLKTDLEYRYYRAGQAFLVEGDSGFSLRTDQVIQYICHLEG